MVSDLRVGVIGSGIGGVSLARALQRYGIDFHLFERAEAFGEVGAGIQMTPNAVKVLKALGLGNDLDRVGFLPEAMVGRNWQTGQQLFRTPLKEICVSAFGAEYYQVHRADLHSILSQDIPDERISFGTECTGVRFDGGRPCATFADGSSYKADLIVGADGIHSPVRRAVWGEDKPQFTGHMAWRALVPVNEYPLSFVGPNAAFWLGPHAHVVTYYVKSGGAVNIVAVAEADKWVEESWTQPSSTQELLNAYTGWHLDLIRLFELTDSDETFKWGLFDHDPMEQWSNHGVTLLGDAAHPMLPFLSQGGAMAVEDGYVLAEALAHYDGQIDRATAAYEAERRPRTADVQLEARERGQSYHLSTPEEIRKRNEAFREAQAKNPNAVGIRAEWVYQYDATACWRRFE